MLCPGSFRLYFSLYFVVCDCSHCTIVVNWNAICIVIVCGCGIAYRIPAVASLTKKKHSLLCVQHTHFTTIAQYTWDTRLHIKAPGYFIFMCTNYSSQRLFSKKKSILSFSRRCRCYKPAECSQIPRLRNIIRLFRIFNAL